MNTTILHSCDNELVRKAKRLIEKIRKMSTPNDICPKDSSNSELYNVRYCFEQIYWMVAITENAIEVFKEKLGVFKGLDEILLESTTPEEERLMLKRKNLRADFKLVLDFTEYYVNACIIQLAYNAPIFLEQYSPLVIKEIDNLKEKQPALDDVVFNDGSAYSLESIDSDVLDDISGTALFFDEKFGFCYKRSFLSRGQMHYLWEHRNTIINEKTMRIWMQIWEDEKDNLYFYNETFREAYVNAEGRVE